MLSTTLPVPAMPTRYLSCAETAKLVRQALKEAFPEVRFYVRSDSYAGGASIRVRWTDGPVVAQVDPIVKGFAGASFDGMADLQSYVDSTLNGEPVSFGANYVFTRRDEDEEKVAAVTEILTKAGRDYWLTLASKMGVEGCFICDCTNADDAARFLLRTARPVAFEGRRSKLAGSITCLGTR